jgi:branched-chain amino acid transport system substrate-binding protein
MRFKRSLLLVMSISLVLLLALSFMAGCSSTTPTTTSAQPPASTTSAPPPASTTSAKPPASTTSAQPPASTTSAPPPASTTAVAPMKELTIGAIQGLTGPSSEAGMLGVHGQQAYAEYINSTGGITIKGEKYSIKIDGADFASSPDGAITAYNKLVYQDKVKFLIGAPFAPVFSVLGEMAEKDKVFMVDESGMGLEISPKSTMTFVTQPEQAILKHSYDLLVKLYPNIKTVAIFAPDEPLGAADIDFSRKEAAAHGLSCVATSFYSQAETNYQPMMTKLLAFKPDAMVSGMGFTGWKANAIKQARELGWKGPMLETTCSGDVRDTVGMLGKFNSDFLTGSYNASDPSMPPEAKAIGDIIKKKYNETLTVDHITQGWQPIQVIVQAIQLAQSLDPVVVRDTLAKATSIDTPFGKGSLGGLKTFGYNHAITRPSVCYQIMNGQINLVEWYTPSLP